jgi:hypothetical protein
LSNIQGYTAYVVPSAGLSGGLWLIWSNDVTVQIIESTRHFIFARIKAADQVPWVLGAIYGDANHRNNGWIWDAIRRYSENVEEAFCCLGDFNAIPDMADKFGGSSFMNTNNRSFQKLIRESDLLDLGYKGPAYTWTNNQCTSNPIYQRLDRVMVTTTWQEKYPRAYVNHLPMIYSDHTPILLRMVPRVLKKHDFRIEHWWLSLEGFDQECSRLWALTEGESWEVRNKELGRGLRVWARQYSLPSNKLRSLPSNKLFVCR